MTDKNDRPHGTDCSCRRCESHNAIDDMADRVGAYNSALSLLAKVKAVEDNPHGPADHLILANWLYYGRDYTDGDDR